LTSQRTQRRTAAVTYVLLFLTLCGCATLPELSLIEYREKASGKLPTIVEDYRPLSRAESEHVLEVLAPDPIDRCALTEHLVLLEQISHLPLIAGNAAELLIDGKQAYPEMLRAVAEARDSVNIESYIFEDDGVGRRFGKFFIERQTAGVQVNIIYDSYGSSRTSNGFFEGLSKAGVLTVAFNPLGEKKTDHPFYRRDHRKILIVDGKVGFTGGINISDLYGPKRGDYEGESKKGEPWRDTQVKIEGPGVNGMQQLFVKEWERQDGPPLSQRNYFPQIERKGDDLVRVLGSAPGDNYLVYLMYLSAITHARHSVHLTVSYFAPDGQMMKALTDAARNGIDVRIVFPHTSDLPGFVTAARSHYSELLAAGVRVYERAGVMLHAKTAVIDSVWSTVGSTNFERWSFMRNNEVNAVIVSRRFARQMENLFDADVRQSQAIDKDQWKKRPFMQKVKEWFVARISYWL
jgi:cardiolipin synthase A/B